MDEQERRRRIAISRAGRRAVADGDPSGWFQPVYAAAAAEDAPADIPWVHLRPNRFLVDWLDAAGRPPGNALVVACGLGDDAEELARRGQRVTAFDVAPAAVAWCRRRFPDSAVEYRVADLFHPPDAWPAAFDLVVEVGNVQALPLALRPDATAAVARLVAPGGVLVAVARGRHDAETDPEGPPWPMSPLDMAGFAAEGAWDEVLEMVETPGDGSVLRWRGVYTRLR